MRASVRFFLCRATPFENARRGGVLLFIFFSLASLVLLLLLLLFFLVYDFASFCLAGTRGIVSLRPPSRLTAWKRISFYFSFVRVCLPPPAAVRDASGLSNSATTPPTPRFWNNIFGFRSPKHCASIYVSVLGLWVENRSSSYCVHFFENPVAQLCFFSKAESFT